MLRSPLPQRFGLDASRARLPETGLWSTVRDYLRDRLPADQHQRVDAMFAAGEYVDSSGVPLPVDAQFIPGLDIWFHRDLPDEVPVPFDVEILYADERIVVVDKPHFLATTPRGGHARQTALVRVREELALPELTPAHRLDRATAGVLLMTTDQRWRGAYQKLFERREVAKTYLAVASRRDELSAPVTVRSHIVKDRGVLQAREVDDYPPNAQTVVELLTARREFGLYRCAPITGKTHQIRVHLARLGIPIVGDPLYPNVLDSAPGDFSSPLQLLAESLVFTDPFTGMRREFRTRRTLEQAASRGLSPAQS